MKLPGEPRTRKHARAVARIFVKNCFTASYTMARCSQAGSQYTDCERDCAPLAAGAGQPEERAHAFDSSHPSVLKGRRHARGEGDGARTSAVARILTLCVARCGGCEFTCFRPFGTKEARIRLASFLGSIFTTSAAADTTRTAQRHTSP